MLKKMLLIIAVLLPGIVLTGCASSLNPPSTELQRRIEAARTPEDHEALAKYFEDEAATSRAEAVKHRKMARSADGIAISGKGGASITFQQESIAKLYEQMAHQSDALAAQHRQLAKKAQPKV